MTSPNSDPGGGPGPVPRLFDHDLIIRRRDRAAAGIAGCDFLLARVADEFADRIAAAKRTFDAGLSLEAYGGLVSRRLRTVPNVTAIRDGEPSARLRALCDGDALATCHATVLADIAALGLAPFDLVVSGLSLQVVDDLPGALSQLRLAMKPDGLLLAALLGGETLRELREAWLVAEEEVSGGASPRVAPFADVRALGGLLQRVGFALPVVDSDTVTVTYADPLRLMVEIKAMAASNALAERRRVPVTRRLLFRAAEVYRERFGTADGRIPATFEIVTLTAFVPHDSQQKPLRPGSATTRLADVLAKRTTND